MEAIGGKAITPGQSVRLNPFSLADTKGNRDFLALWIGELMDPTGRGISEGLLAFLHEVVAQLYALPLQERSLHMVHQLCAQKDPQLGMMLASWVSDPEKAALFGAGADDTPLEQHLLALDVSRLRDRQDLLVPVVSYALHRITTQLKGEPAVIVLDEGWRLLNNPAFAPRLKPWLEFLRSKNVAVIFTTEYPQDATEYPFHKAICEQVQTQFFMPDASAGRVYFDGFGLSGDEIDYLQAMDASEERHFLMKRATDTVVATLDLSGMDEALAVLSGMRHPAPQPAIAQVPPEDAGTLWEEIQG
jgi:type IV secretion system protein VirB4